MPTAADLRRDVAQLVTFANEDLDQVWRSLTSADQARRELEQLLPHLIQTYGVAASTVAANWYDELRDEMAVAGSYTSLTAEFKHAAVGEVLARWALGPLFGPPSKNAWPDALTLTQGGLQRHITDQARDTVRVSAVEDPQSEGWMRDAAGGCGFCQAIAGSAVVHDQATLDFAGHDHCQCHAVPAFVDRPRPVQPYRPDVELTTDEQARASAYLASSGGG
jgi:hypothetical protein